MKRSCFTGLLLSAAIFASEIRAPGQTNVYSLNVGSFLNIHIAGAHANGLSIQQIWSAGPVGVNEVTCWADASGQLIPSDPSRRDQPGDFPISRTQVQIGSASLSIPLAVRWTGLIGIIVAAAVLFWGWVTCGKTKPREPCMVDHLLWQNTR